MDNQNIDQCFDLRVNKGLLPTINIAGHTFYVDLRMDMLRPKDYFLSDGIVFSETENYYDDEKRLYTIPYNPKTHGFQKPDYQTVSEIPKDLIAIQFPSEKMLDRIGWNRKHGFELRHGLDERSLKLHFEAKLISWEKTFLVNLIKRNQKTEKKLKKNIKKQPSENPQIDKSKGRKI